MKKANSPTATTTAALKADSAHPEDSEEPADSDSQNDRPGSSRDANQDFAAAAIVAGPADAASAAPGPGVARRSTGRGRR